MRFDIHTFLESRDAFGSVSDEGILLPGVNVAATRSPRLYGGRDVSESELGAKFSGQLRSPRYRLAIMRS